MATLPAMTPTTGTRSRHPRTPTVGLPTPPSTMGDISFEAPEWDKERITALTRELAAPGIRGVRRQLREAMPTGYDPREIRGREAAIRGHGEALSSVMGAARGAAGVEYGQEYGREFEAEALEFGAQTQAALEEKRMEWQTGESALERQFRMEEREAGQTWQSAETELQRKWGTGERIGGEKWQEQQSELMREFQKAQAEADRSFRAGESEKEREWREKADKLMRQWQTQERLAGQKYGTGERVAGQEWRTGERLGAQEWETAMELPWGGDFGWPSREDYLQTTFGTTPLGERKHGGRVKPATMITLKRQLGGPLRKGAPLYMVGEAGPELVKYDSGRSELVGQTGPERRTFPEPGRVIPAGKTKKLLATPIRRQGGGRVDPGQGMDWGARLEQLMGRYPELRMPKVVQQDIQMIRGQYTNRMNQLLQGIAQTRVRPLHERPARSPQDLLNPYRGVEALERGRDARIEEIMGFWRGRGRQGPAIHTAYDPGRFIPAKERERFPERQRPTYATKITGARGVG